MKYQLEQRLAALQSEYAAGQKMLADLDERRTTLTNTLLRIQGAMQVLEELLGQSTLAPGGTGPAAGEPRGPDAAETP